MRNPLRLSLNEHRHGLSRLQRRDPHIQAMRHPCIRRLSPGRHPLVQTRSPLPRRSLLTQAMPHRPTRRRVIQTQPPLTRERRHRRLLIQTMLLHNTRRRRKQLRLTQATRLQISTRLLHHIPRLSLRKSPSVRESREVRTNWGTAARRRDGVGPMVRPLFYGMAKNPRVTENESAAGGRGVVDVGCSLFARSLGRRYAHGKSAVAQQYHDTRKVVFSMIVLVYGTIRRVKSTSSARKIRIRRLALVLASIIGTWAFLGFLATIPVTGNHPYWRTFRARPEDFGLQAENVSFSSQEGILLKGWYIRPRGASHGTVIVAHGINGNRSDMLSRAAILVHHNYGALLIDLRDHGESGGHFTGPGYVESRDILGALKFLRSQGQVGPVDAMGHSYGAVAALYAAADSPDLAAVVADGAFISFGDMVSRATILLSQDPERSFWERFGLRLAGFRGVEWAVKPIYYLRTGIWLTRGETNTLAPKDS